MLTDPEERRKMRQQKAAERRQRQVQSRKLFLRLGIAAVVLVACGILIFSLSKKAPEQNTSHAGTSPPEQNTTGQTAPPETTTPPTTVIHYAAVGDLNVNESTVYAGGASLLYTDTFMDVAHLLSDADITSVNFEGTLCGEPYGSSASAPQSMAEALRSAGVDLVQMANSYSISRGLSGLASSIDAVRTAGMEPLGVYATNADFKEGKGYTIRVVNGIKLAFVAFTKGMDGMALPEGSENCVNLLYEDYDSVYQDVDTAKITSILEAIAKEEPDLVVALLHWGSEFNNTISASQEEIAKLLQSYGVDAIIGTHSHYVQKMTLDETSGQFIAYSLGDFFSDGKKSGSEYSVVLDLEITKDNTTGETKITNYSYTPIFTVHDPGMPLRVVRIQEAMAAYESNYINKISEDTYNQMLYAQSRIEARIAGE